MQAQTQPKVLSGVKVWCSKSIYTEHLADKVSISAFVWRLWIVEQTEKNDDDSESKTVAVVSALRNEDNLNMALIFTHRL